MANNMQTAELADSPMYDVKWTMNIVWRLCSSLSYWEISVLLRKVRKASSSQEGQNLPPTMPPYPDKMFNVPIIKMSSW